MNLFHWLAVRLFGHIDEGHTDEADWAKTVDDRIENAFVLAEQKHGTKLDRKSFVDLLKALGFPDNETTLASRKELAAKWGYTGNTGAVKNSADMNEWLFNEAMVRLHEFGEL